MIFKYALFTLVVSIIPMLMIFKDLSITLNVAEFVHRSLSLINLRFIENILSSGVFTFLTSANNNMGMIKHVKSVDVFTIEELNKFTGNNGKVLYLAILGHVFDVSKAAKYYGPGQTYNAFTGRDGSRAFVTGDFSESGLTDDVTDLSFQELCSLNHWLKFYKKEYIYKGKLVGRYFDESGKPTGYYHKVQLKIEEAERNEKDKNKYKLMFPPCNVEWTPKDGSRVWCSQRSGGVERDWVGVPRKLYEPGAETYRCACINVLDKSQLTASETGKTRARNLEEYEDCHPESSSCYVPS